jgi:SAM-dependent methyltransferase
MITCGSLSRLAALRQDAIRSAMSEASQIVFDRALARQRRSRSADGFSAAAFLKDAMVEGVLDRLLGVARTFETVLDLGAHDGRLLAGLPGTFKLATDVSERFARLNGGLAADEEMSPFADASFDLIASAGSLHWVNDLPGALIQINRALKPDGLFLGALLGGDTLTELRQSFLLAEVEISGGVSPRVSPFLDVRDGGSLLQRAGFAMPVADVDRLVVDYAHPLNLLRDLRAMGETNVALARSRRPLTRALLGRMAEIYIERFARADGRIPATFHIITLSGWAPAPGQPRPLRPGSAKQRLADALGVLEVSAGEKARGEP